MDEIETKKMLGALREEMTEWLRWVNSPLREVLGLNLVTHEDEAERRAKGVARFYKELVSAEIDKTTALELTKSIYMDPAVITKEYLLKELEVIKEIALTVISHGQQEKAS
jgi:hypothetical protein